MLKKFTLLLMILTFLTTAVTAQENGWTTLTIGQSVYGIRYDQAGAVIVNNDVVMGCVPDPQSAYGIKLLVSQPSPLKKLVLVMCSRDNEDEAYIIDTLHNRVVSRDVVPKHWQIIPWVSWSPDERFALVAAAGEITMGDMAFINLASGRSEEITFKNFTNNRGIDPRQTVSDRLQDFDPDKVSWLSNSSFRLMMDVRCNPYEAGQDCYEKIISSHPVRVSLNPFSISYSGITPTRTSGPRQTGAIKVRRPPVQEASTDNGRSSSPPAAGSYTKMTFLRNLLFDAPVIFVHSVTFSPDSRIVAGMAETGSALKINGSKSSIRLWDVKTGKMERRIAENSFLTDVFSFSPNGKTLATSHEGTVKLWDTQTWQVKRILQTPLNPNLSGSVHSVAFSSDSNLIVVLAGDIVFLWDAQTGELLWSHDVGSENEDPFAATLESAVFSPDGQTVAVGGGISGARVRFYETRTGNLLDVWQSVASNMSEIAYSPDGQLLAIGGGSDGTLPGSLGVWDVRAKQLKVDLPLDFDGGYVRSLAFSPDGKTIVSVSDDKARLWDVQTGKMRSVMPGEGTTSVAFSPDGRMIVVGNKKGIRLWTTQGH